MVSSKCGDLVPVPPYTLDIYSNLELESPVVFSGKLQPALTRYVDSNTPDRGNVNWGNVLQFKCRP